MSKKDIDKKENRLNILDLKLNGDKIKLETRPELKSNLLSQDQCRPLSAIPSLSLYSKDTYNFNVLSRRPYSAGELLYKPSSKDDEFLSAEAGATSLESLDEERSLPSSQIFKDLISEPIQSYKSNPENLRNSVLEHRNEVNSFDSYNPLQAAEKNEQYTDCPLTPGLTSKPPLPKKSDNKCKNKGGSKDNNLLNNDEIELIRLKTLKFEEDSLKKYERNDLNEEVIFKLEEIKSEKDFHTFLERRQNDIEKSVNAQFNTSYAEDEDLRLLDKVADNMDSSKTRYELLSHREASDNMKSPDILTSKSDSEIITSQDLHFKNWLAEDGHVEKNVSKSEERTDSFLKNLKANTEKLINA
ncbi:hypothetical protein QE152_g13703 [Popillia japonica]|uniref:Uncharacterized protein n=1 Tax=Popillia japonica TaxID=7064 RepID=A0AAW1L8R3_POPJA